MKSGKIQAIPFLQRQSLKECLNILLKLRGKCYTGICPFPPTGIPILPQEKQVLKVILNLPGKYIHGSNTEHFQQTLFRIKAMQKNYFKPYSPRRTRRKTEEVKSFVITRDV